MRKAILKATLETVAVALAAIGIAGGVASASGTDGDGAPSTNVNSRYIVEKVSISGWNNAIARPLREELDQVVGQKLDHPKLESLASQLKRQLHVADVTIRISKGTEPDHVVVNFAVVQGREQNFDLKIAKFLYDSGQGWSGEGDAATRFAGNEFTFGVVSDADAQLERFTGIRARFERKHVATDRLGLAFEFDDFHNIWNDATLAAAQSSGAAAESSNNAAESSGAAAQSGNDGAEIYRSRQVFEPEATVELAQPLEIAFGARFSRFQQSTPAARTESSNAVVSTLRYHQRWGSDSDPQQQEAEASYSIEAATGVLSSDPRYTRHLVRGRYKIRHELSSLEVRFLAGLIHGPAPLFDRFVLGNAETLRGWSKFDVDPLGGSRVVYGSVDYVYRILQVFYDTGAVWDRGQDRERRQSAGVGLKKKGFQLAVAFPLEEGPLEPVFFAGMNF